MSPHEIVTATATVARSFGDDIAHEVCRIYLTKRPTFTGPPIHWWRATARTYRLDREAYKTVRRAKRYRAEMGMSQRRVLNPEQTVTCWEMLERVPTDVLVALVDLEGCRGNERAGRLQRTLRRQAQRAASRP